ncbi:MAG: LamG domain-containing protein [Methylococcaceae bacterium]
MQKIKALIFFSMLLVSCISLADLNTGLVAYYSFDDCTANDSSSKKYNGTINGNTLCVDGAKNKGLFFDGIDSYIDINVPLDGMANWSICSWVNIAKIDSSYTDWQAFFTAVDNSSNETTELGFPTDSKALSIYPLLTAKANTAVVGKNTLMCFTKSSNNLLIFKDGVKIASGTGSTNFSILKTIGMWQPWSSDPFNKEPFNGIIDEVRAYKRTLSASEIQSLYYQVNPPIIQGTAPWVTQHIVVCENITQNTSITLPSTNASTWDCEKSGLAINHGDEVIVTIKGKKY